MRSVRKIAKSDYWLRYVCLSMTVRMEQLGSHWKIFMKIYICLFFENLSIKFDFCEILTRITGALYEDQCTFTIISRSVLLRMRNISE